MYECMNVSCMHVCVTSMKYVFMCEFSELLSFTFSMKELKSINKNELFNIYINCIS